MGSAFTIIIFGLVGLVVIVGLLAAVLNRESPYDRIGRGGFSQESPSPPPGASSGEQEEEIRQMLQARNERRERQGRDPVDIDEEIGRLLARAPAGPGDPALAEEVRQHVLARNERRARQGKAPLDVDAEVERQLRDLGA